MVIGWPDQEDLVSHFAFSLHQMGALEDRLDLPQVLEQLEFFKKYTGKEQVQKQDEQVKSYCSDVNERLWELDQDGSGGDHQKWPVLGVCCRQGHQDLLLCQISYVSKKSER